MPYRALPNTDVQRRTALETCKLKADATLLANRAISPANFALLGPAFVAFDAAMVARGGSMSGQLGSTDESEAAFHAARQWISHFIQTLNLAIERGVFPSSVRGFYQLDGNQVRLPQLSSEHDLMTWGGRLKTGEPARVAAGGAAITFPSIAEVNAVYDDFVAKRQAQSGMSDAEDEKEEAVAALRPAADALIKDLWDEIEFKFRHEPASSLRGKAREWGVVYVPRAGEPVENLPGQPVIDAAVALPDQGYHLDFSLAEGADSFEVWGKAPGATEFTLVADGITDATYEATGQALGEWQFRVYARNANGRGPASEVASVTVE